MSAARVHWCRLYRETVSDFKLTSRPPAERWLWIVLLCLAQDHDGVVELAPDVGYTPEHLAGVAGVDVATVAAALPWFKQMNMTDADDRGVIRLVHWDDRQCKSDRSADRVARHRERKARATPDDDGDASDAMLEGVHNETLQKRFGNVSVTPREEKRREEKRREENTPPSPPPANAGSVSYPDDFLEFYRAYPRKVRKSDALKAWKQTTKLRPPLADILVRLAVLAASEEWTKDGGQYVPYPAKWLRQGGWDDEPRPAAPAGTVYTETATATPPWHPDDVKQYGQPENLHPRWDEFLDGTMGAADVVRFLPWVQAHPEVTQ